MYNDDDNTYHLMQNKYSIKDLEIDIQKEEVFKFNVGLEKKTKGNKETKVPKFIIESSSDEESNKSSGNEIKSRPYKTIFNMFIKAVSNKNKTVNEELVSDNLYTKNIPDPDILIRTGGEKRLSNFLLWQLSYAELFFLDKNWPDFSFSDLKKIISKFSSIKRKFGGLNE